MPVPADLEAARQLGDTLRELGFDEPGLIESFSRHAEEEPLGTELSHLAHRLDPGRPLHIVIAAFVLRQVVARERLEAALGPDLVAGLVETGLFESTADGLRCPLSLRPTGPIVVAADPVIDDPDAEVVIGINPTAMMLAGLTVRRGGERVADIGTGGGLQALAAADHAAEVIGVDLNPRALDLARFNAALNQRTSIEWREGDLFEPLADEQFDLIVSNPPFVVSPENEHLYRDTPHAGDDISRIVVEGVAERLVDDGYATVLVNWGIGAGEPSEDKPARWTAGLGCDALVVHYTETSIYEYAELWNRRRTDPSQWIDRWVAHLDGLGYQRIGMGGVILRRRHGDHHWIHHLHPPSGRYDPSTHQILRIAAGLDLTRLHGDEALSSAVLTPAPEVVLDQRLVPTGGGFKATELRIGLQDGLKLSADADASVFEVVSRLDGRSTVAEVVAAVDAVRPPASTRAGARAAVTALLEHGFLDVAG